jgi:hypothetical protein
LLQTNFFPLFTQVNVLPALTLLIPALVQELPVFTAPIAGWVIEVPRKKRARASTRTFFIPKRLLSPIEFVCTSTQLE